MADKIPIHVTADSATSGSPPQAVRCGSYLFVTGQVGILPDESAPLASLEDETRNMLAEIASILEAAGCPRTSLLKVTLLMTDIRDFKRIDDVYRDWLPAPESECWPVRTALQVAGLPGGARMQMDLVVAAS